MTNRALFPCAALCLTLSIANTHGTSYYFPKFGTPLVVGDQLIFDGPGLNQHRIICVSRESGSKRWEIVDEERSLMTQFPVGDRVLITKDGDLHWCKVEDGSTELLLETGSKHGRVTRIDATHALVSRLGENYDQSMVVDLSSATVVWRNSGPADLLAAHDLHLLLLVGESRRQDDGKLLWHFNQRLVALGREGWKINWTKPLGAEFAWPAACQVGDYFVVSHRGKLQCLEVATGALVTEQVMGETSLSSIAIAAKGDHVLASTTASDGPVENYVLHSFTVPGLKKLDLPRINSDMATLWVHDSLVIGRTVARINAVDLETGKTIWEGGQWNWDGVHDGQIYFSEMSADGNSTSVNRINVTTGQQVLIYEEKLPEALRWR